jgi:hypothetical protein
MKAKNKQALEVARGLVGFSSRVWMVIAVAICCFIVGLCGVMVIAFFLLAKLSEHNFIQTHYELWKALAMLLALLLV